MTVADKTLTRIAALLRKAEGTDNEHEASAYMAAAQRLATLESIDLAVARSHTAGIQQRAVPQQRTISIGQSGKRGLGTYVQLFVAIARANEVTCDVARNSTFVYAYGFAADMDTCEALYSSLVVQMVGACERFLRSGLHKQELTWGRDSRTGTLVRRPVHGVTARINFQNAFALVIGERLASARERANREAELRYSTNGRSGGDGGNGTEPGQVATAGPATSGVALAIREKELEIKDFYSLRSQARGAWRGGTVGHSEASRRAGARAGRRAQLGERSAIGGSRRAVGPGG